MIRIIAHLDMDSFFASVEESNSPIFKGKPIVVGSDPRGGLGRGVVSTANYKAREYGIHSAMPISHAWRASQLAVKQGKEEVVFVLPDFELYQKSSQNVLQIIKKYSQNVQQASIDEFYFDLSHTNSFKKSEKICQDIKKEIKKEEKITCSVGIGPNKLISKIAAGMKKPDGMVVVEARDAESFLAPLEIRQIPGIGPKTAQVFYKKNITTVKDLKKFSEQELIDLMGKWGRNLYQKIRGIDHSPIEADREAKSIGEQTTFEKDTFDMEVIFEQFNQCCRHVFERFKKSGFAQFKTIAIVVRFSDFTTKTSSKSFKIPLKGGDHKTYTTEMIKLLLPFLDKRKNPKLRRIRLIGARIENLSHEDAPKNQQKSLL